MKISVNDLRQIIREEFRGVPSFVFAEETRKYVDAVRAQLARHILVDRSSSSIAQREAFEAMEETLTDLEKEVNEVLEDKLYGFLQQV